MNDDNETVEVEEELVVLKPNHFGWSNATKEGELSLSWVPYLHPLHGLFGKDQIPMRAGAWMGIYRKGYSEDPLGVIASSTSYVPVNHTDSAQTVASCGADIAYVGAKIEGHGFTVAHAFRLTTFNDAGEPHMIAGLPVNAVLNLVHSHTGTGAIHASVVLYLGTGERCRILGAKERIRKIHKGAGKKDVGVGSNSNWASGIAALCEKVIVDQVSTVDLLKQAHRTELNATNAKVLEDAGITVECWEEGGVKIYSGNLLDAISQHHKAKKGSNERYGVWARRLETDGFKALEKILRP